jgi:hypothetical protein
MNDKYELDQGENIFDKCSSYILDLEVDEHMPCSNNISLPLRVYKDFVTNFDGPYNLTLTDQKTGKISYCCMTDMHNGNKIKVPSNVYDNLLSIQQISINLHEKPVPKGDLIKLRPCTKNFIEIKALDKELEKIFSQFSMLSTNQNITIPYNGKKYPFIITDVYSDNNTQVSVINVVNRNIKLDLINPFLDELVNDKMDEQNKKHKSQDALFNMSKITGGFKYDGKTPMNELRKFANY